MSNAPVDQGGNAAIEFLRGTRDYVDCLSPLERAQWFCGFITATASWSKGTIGWHHTETALLAALDIVPKTTPPNGDAGGG